MAAKKPFDDSMILVINSSIGDVGDLEIAVDNVSQN